MKHHNRQSAEKNRRAKVENEECVARQDVNEIQNAKENIACDDRVAAGSPAYGNARGKENAQRADPQELEASPRNQGKRHGAQQQGKENRVKHRHAGRWLSQQKEIAVSQNRKRPDSHPRPGLAPPIENAEEHGSDHRDAKEHGWGDRIVRVARGKPQNDRPLADSYEQKPPAEPSLRGGSAQAVRCDHRKVEENIGCKQAPGSPEKEGSQVHQRASVDQEMRQFVVLIRREGCVEQQ